MDFGDASSLAGLTGTVNAMMAVFNSRLDRFAWWELLSPIAALSLGILACTLVPVPFLAVQAMGIRVFLGVGMGLSAMGAHAGGKKIAKTINPGVLQ
jgi:hypothetical protein